METKSLENFLKSFGNQVVRDAKLKLNKAKKGNTQLENSIRVEVVPTAKGFSTKFYMYEYGEYLDKGVSGTETEQSFTNYRGGNEKTDFKYTNRKGHSQPPSGIIEKWIKKKGLKGRVNKKWKGAGNRGGQFITDKSFAFLIARGIGRHGIKSLSFFQEPFGSGYSKLKKEMLPKLKLDIETYLTTFYRPK